jgi:hypothetical protein
MGDTELTSVLVAMAVGNFVGIDVTVGSNTCPGPQPEMNRLKAKTRGAMIRCFAFISSPMFS